jgi:hypothetical protein
MRKGRDSEGLANYTGRAGRIQNTKKERTE